MLKAKREKKEADSHPSVIPFSFFGHCLPSCLYDFSRKPKQSVWS